ncbi:hypothetical protein G0Q06_12675 [Puniceicoccales bacterium CK1056]|uniref:Uncharacterized protein n=1 Tax=Oceanipulchritudo coccoides TaxID=2706888 RepID=A0A6B2M4V5_9BACT|nr:hypothetical protein [Oceanipulchritudo coccoides]NDV63312.1 hypothetical protein [Oceanipulchritudo coccoides]
MSRQRSPQRKARGYLTQSALTIPGLYLLVFGLCGWLVLIANLFGIAGRSGWIFPAVEDIAGLGGSTVLLLLIGLTPLAIRQTFFSKGKEGK